MISTFFQSHQVTVRWISGQVYRPINLRSGPCLVHVVARDFATERLEQRRIEAHLSPQSRALLTELALLDQVDSTNAEAVRRLQSGGTPGLVISAEQQTAGRGRHGRRWVSPHGVNLYVTTVWQFQRGTEAMSGLSLAVGVAVADALEQHGLRGAGLKWPNDILHDGAKLGGILIESAGNTGGPVNAVIGIGINLAMPEQAGGDIDQPWTDAARAGLVDAGRNELLAALLYHLLPLLAGFEDGGFEPWRERWLARNVHRDQPVVLTSGARSVVGTVAGLDHCGALLLDVGGTVQAFSGGELSLRSAT